MKTFFPAWSTQQVYFINILWEPFLRSALHSFSLLVIFLAKEYWPKVACKMLRKFTKGVQSTKYKGSRKMLMKLTPGIFPTANYKSVRVIPGHVNTITVTASLQSADPDISLISPNDRNCLFPEETQFLRLHQNYSQYSCLLECSLQFAQSVVQVRSFLRNFLQL